MSKIFPSGSGVYFENVQFNDLESSEAGKGAFFVRKCPAEPQSTEATGGNGQTGPSDPQQPVKTTAADLEAIREEAYQKGRAEGRREGKSEGRSEVENELHTATQALAEALEQISRLRASLLEKSKEDMVRLVMAVARQVIQTEVEENGQIIVKTVTRALEAAVESDEYYIRVNPADLSRVKESEPLFLAAMKGLQNIHFIADESVSQGGCRAESRAGDVDAALETQLEKIYAHLRSEIVE